MFWIDSQEQSSDVDIEAELTDLPFIKVYVFFWHFKNSFHKNCNASLLLNPEGLFGWQISLVVHHERERVDMKEGE